ncbi:hypothetical protein C7S14_7684 [Burkholderia cepacia]|nr:hypothetical protein C7S14_7684 [Burkholderia cepacia]
MTISFHCANDFTMKPFHYGWDPICVEERSATLPHRATAALQSKPMLQSPPA